MANVASAVADDEEIHEVWRTGPNQIEVYVQNAKREGVRHVRITALENLKSGATPKYMASYEAQAAVTDAEGNERQAWLDVDYPWQDGDTAEDCLAKALLWVAME